MTAFKYSRQRESIINYLESTKEHPTADTIYHNIRKTYPNVSLGTVYRNLSLLVNIGRIQRLTCGDGVEHYDAVIRPHYHFICDQCCSVSDLKMPIDNSLNEEARKYCDNTINGHRLLFHGVCNNCKRKEVEE